MKQSTKNEQADKQNNMGKKKPPREKGKLKFSKMFQILKTGDTVALHMDKSMKASFPERMNGRTGTVAGMRGRSYIVKANDYNQEKTFIIQPIHLRKLGVKK